MRIKNNILSIVVLFWNDSEKTIKCLNSIYKQKKINFTLVIVDNNSDKKYSNKVIKWLKNKKVKIFKTTKENFNFDFSKYKKKYIYIKNKINFGCGLGHNPGYKFCLKHNFKYIARIDNDMILPTNLMSKLCRRLDNNKDIIAMSPKVMFLDKPNLIWFRGAKIGNNLKFQRQCSDYDPGHADTKKYRGLVKTDSIVGCASIMRSKNLKQAGLSDPDFFYGEEDIELSNRLKKTNGNLMVDLDQKIYHAVSHTIGKNWAKNVYYNYKYRLLLLKKMGTILDKSFGYTSFVIKLFLMMFLSFKIRYSSKLIPVLYAGLHYLGNKYGDYDRINYKRVDAFFSEYSKKTSLKDIFINIKKKNLI